MCNLRRASAQTMLDILKSGYNVILNAGGLYEQMHWRNDKEIAYFSNVLTLLAFSRKYQNICVQVLYMKLREMKKLVNF